MARVDDLGMRDLDGRLLGRRFIDTIHQGRRVRAVGSQIVFRPPEETKHEFFVHVLANTLGNEWKQAQDRLPPEGRHPIVGWIAAWDEMRSSDSRELDRRGEGPSIYSSTATGDLAALMVLAYDVYTLRHAMALDPDDAIAKRLGHREQFQGARYERAAFARERSAGPASVRAKVN